MRNGWSSYTEPAAYQFAPWDFLGFGDNVFFLMRDRNYWPAVNILLFVGAIATCLTLNDRDGPHRDRGALFLLGGAALTCIFFAFGIVPATWILATPVLNNIHHIHNTFAVAALIPTSVLGGVGIAYLLNCDSERLRRVAWRSLVVLVFLVGWFFRDRAQIKEAVSYLAISLTALALLIVVLRSRSSHSPSPQVLGLLVIVGVLLVGRGAAWGDTADRIDYFVFNPKDRVDLLRETETIEKARLTFNEPIRAIGLGNAFFSGYRSSLSFESIDGPEALEVREYRRLVEALGLPYEWTWRATFSSENIAELSPVLSFLNVGLVFSPDRVPATPALVEIASEQRLTVYKRTHAWPRAFFTDRLQTYESLTDLKSQIFASSVPFVAVEKGKELTATSTNLMHARNSDPIVVPATSYRLTNNTTSFVVEAPGPGIAYLGEANIPGDFIVTLNGRTVEYFPANHAFKGVLIPAAGTYVVAFSYWPARLWWYLAISSASTVLLVLFMWRASKRFGSAASQTLESR